MQNNTELLRIAMWLREARHLPGASVTKTPERVTINIEGQAVDLATVSSKVSQLDLGLGPEDEFLALSVWMGNCVAIHRLQQELCPLSARQDYKIPDYLAVYKYNGRPVPVLLEVKSTFGKEELEFTGSYYNKLRNYAQLVNLPLLIAWKYKDHGFWCLFEPERMQKRASALHIPFFEAVKNDLTGILLGNVHVVVREGSQLVMNIKKLKQESQTQFLGEITDLYWANWRGERIEPHPAHFGLFFIFCEDEDSAAEDANQVTQTFQTTQDWGVIGYKLLPAALGFPNLDNGEPIDWMQMARRNSFPVTYADIVKSAKDGLKNGLVRYILALKPTVMPSFLSCDQQS